MSNKCGKQLSVLKYGTVSKRPKYYLAGAVNRFLRPEPFNISNDPLQECIAESGSGGDGYTAGVRKDQSGKAACQLSASLLTQAGEKTPNTEIQAPEQLDDSPEESVATFYSVAHLSLREKNTVSLENSSRPKIQDEMKNADGLLLLAPDRGRNRHTEDQLEVGSQPEGYEDEDNLSADNQPTDELEVQDTRITTTDVNRGDDVRARATETDTATIAVEHKHTAYGSATQTKSTNINGQSDAMTGESEEVAKVEVDLFSADNNDSCEEEVASAVPVKPEARTAQEIGKAFKNMPLSVCDLSQRLLTPTCEEPLPEHNNEAFPHGNKTLVFLEVEKSEEIRTHRHLQEEAESKEQGRLQNGSGAKRHRILAGETKATCASSKMGVKLPERELGEPWSRNADDMEDLQEEVEVVDLEHAKRLYDVAGDDNETRRETVGFSRDKDWMVDVESNLTGSPLTKGEMKPERCAVEDARNDTEEQDLMSEEGLKDTRTTLDLMTTTMRNTEETTLSSVSQHRDVITEVIILETGMQTASPEENFDSKQDELSNESLEKRYDMESFTVISSPESGFSDQSFGEAPTVACAREAAKASAAFAVEQANEQEVLEMNSLEILTMDSKESPKELSRYSGEPLKAKILQSLDKVDKPKSEIEVNSLVLNFAPQRSRIAVKNPRVRPPKDRHSLLQRPSVDPVSTPAQPASKIPVGVQVLGGLGFGLKLPGLGAGVPVVKKLSKVEAELKPVPKADATKQAEVPPKPKWMPPRQAGFGNPFISELKTKLKKATKN